MIRKKLLKKLFFIFISFILILIFSNSLEAQSNIPMCTSPQNLVIWPNMTTHTIPMAVGPGILGSSPIKYLRSSPTQFVHLGSSVTVRSNGGDNRDELTSSTALWVKWGGIYTSGPKKGYHSGGSITFMDDSTSTNKKFYNIFYIEQSPSYMYWENNERRYRNNAYGNLRFSYGEHNPTNATITGRLGAIPPRKTIYNSNLMTLTWDGKLLIGGSGTETPIETLDVRGNILSSATITAQRFCLGNDCRNTWPSGGASYWTLSGNNNLYATPTNVKIGIGTTTPQAKLHVIGDILSSATITAPYIHAPTITAPYMRVNTLVANNNLISNNTISAATIIANNIIGIGTTTPRAKLHVVGETLIESNDGRVLLKISEE